MSANYHCPTDEELCEKHIDTLRKLYKIERPLPKHITDDITRVLENIGWSCWFADWINHRVYCWVLEINASKSKPELPDFMNWEDIKSDDESEEDDMRLDEESEDENKKLYEEYGKKNEDFDEYGFCKYCNWNSCQQQSHIEYCGYGNCEYIKKKYGELELKRMFEEEYGEEEKKCENACSIKENCFNVSQRFKCNHYQCSRTTIILNYCIACGETDRR